MFNKIHKMINDLNTNIDNEDNYDTAKRLKRRLMLIGLPLSILGFIGIAVCFMMFATAGFSAFDMSGYSYRLNMSYVLFLPCVLMAGIGNKLISLSLKITAVCYSTKKESDTTSVECSHCGETTDEDDVYCPKCGTRLKNECPQCKYVNNPECKFCVNCGTKLNEK